MNTVTKKTNFLNETTNINSVNISNHINKIYHLSNQAVYINYVTNKIIFSKSNYQKESF